MGSPLGGFDIRLDTTPAPAANPLETAAAQGGIAVMEHREPALAAGLAIPPSVDLAPTGALVVELWDATPDSFPLEDWHPTLFDPDRRDHRHRLVRLVYLGLILVLVATAAWYLTGWRTDRQREATARVASESAALAIATDRLSVAIDDLADGGPVDVSLAGTSLADVDAAARRLFDAASSLDPDADPARRASGLDLAQQALDIENTVGDGVTYGSAFRLMAERPYLPTSVPEDDVSVVAADVAWWVSRFADGAGMLPDVALLEPHREKVEEMAAELGGWQSDYLKAVRSDDEAAATTEVGELDARIGALESEWVGHAGELAAWARQALDELRSRLDVLSRSG